MSESTRPLSSISHSPPVNDTISTLLQPCTAGLLVLNQQQMSAIKLQFDGADDDGVPGLSLDEFVNSFKDVFNKSINELTHLFMKIDANSDGTVDWDEFVDFILMGDTANHSNTRSDTLMYNEYNSDTQVEFIYYKQLNKSIQHNYSTVAHNDIITCMIYVEKFNCYITGSKDGTVKIYNIDTYQLVKTIVFSTQSWINDICYMTSCNLLVVCGMNRLIQFYDITPAVNHDTLPVSKIIGLGQMYNSTHSITPSIKYINTLTSGSTDNQSYQTSTPTCLDTCVIGDIEYLLVGDDCGNLAIFQFTSLKWHICDGSSDMQCKCEPNVLHWSKYAHCTILKLLHKSWISRVRYDYKMLLIITSSHDGTLAVTDIHKLDQQLSNPRRIFDDTEHKPLYDFTYSHKYKLVATCGLGRKLCLWNTFSAQHYSLLGHTTTVTNCLFDDQKSILISLDTSRVVKIWDISVVNEGKCLQTISDHTQSYHQRSDIKFGSMYYHSQLNRLLLCGSVPFIYISKEKVDVGPRSHTYPVLRALYNRSFNQIISADLHGCVTVWDLDTGLQVYRFNTGLQITAITFDIHERRVVMGTHTGGLYIYNFSNGSCLSTLINASNEDELHNHIHQDSEITGVLYGHKQPVQHDSDAHSNDVQPDDNVSNDDIIKYVVSVGWNRHANVWYDHSDHAQQYIHHTMPAHRSINGHNDDILCVAVCCNHTILATGSFDNTICLWRFTTGELLHRLYIDHNDTHKLGDYAVNGLQYSAVHNLLLSIHNDGCIRFWNITTAQCTCSKNISSHALTCIELTDNNQHVLVGDSSGVAYVVSLAQSTTPTDKFTDRLVLVQSSWQSHYMTVTSIDYIPQYNQLILTSSSDCTVVLWTFDGIKIGMFTQSVHTSQLRGWNLHDTNTYIGIIELKKSEQLKLQQLQREQLIETHEIKIKEKSDGRPRLIWRHAAAAALQRQHKQNSTQINTGTNTSNNTCATLARNSNTNNNSNNNDTTANVSAINQLPKFRLRDILSNTTNMDTMAVTPINPHPTNNTVTTPPLQLSSTTNPAPIKIQPITMAQVKARLADPNALQSNIESNKFNKSKVSRNMKLIQLKDYPLEFIPTG